MELTNLKHELTIAGSPAVEIDEPVGFDSLKVTIKRGNYHGISVAMSETDLEFYDSNNHKAATLLKTAYESDIETEIEYKAYDRDTLEVAYQGQVDLSTYSENAGAYFSVRCQVGEINAKTTFNNRVETKIDLNTDTTLDGTTLTHSYPWQRIEIPAKTIIYTNQIKQKYPLTWTEATSPTGRYHTAAGQRYQFIGLQLSDRTELAEFGDFNTGLTDIASDITVPSGEILDNLNLLDYYQPIYSKGDESAFYSKFGVQDYSIDIDIEIALTAESKLFDDTPHADPSSGTWTGKDLYYRAKLVLIDGAATFGSALQYPLASSAELQVTNSAATSSYSFTLQTTLTGVNPNHLILGIIMYAEPKETNPGHPERNAPNRILQANIVTYTTTDEGGLTMKLNSKRTEPLEADTLLVHEAANKIAEVISEEDLNVTSDYYSRQDSPVNPKTRDAITGVGIGDGSLKAITQGYKMRGLATTNEQDRSWAMSFKDLIEALNSIDCIGWGFSEESGSTKIRIEPWEWFYKNTTTLTLTSPNGMTRSIDADRVVTALTIGYKKYTETDEINSSDTIHGERSFNTNSKIMNKEETSLCDFIADNFAIEETRRKALASGDTSDFKYDDKTFILELKAALTGSTAPYGLEYHVANDSIRPYTQAINMYMPDECYNLRISPRRNAGRWQSYVAQFNSTRDFKFVTGKMNCSAAYQTRPDGVNSADGKFYYYHKTAGTTYETFEDGTLLNDGEITRKERVTLTYPLTQAEFAALKAAPYGLIKVDGVDYWLQEAKYEIKTGKTDFTLIPKID